MVTACSLYRAAVLFFCMAVLGFLCNAGHARAAESPSFAVSSGAGVAASGAEASLPQLENGWQAFIAGHDLIPEQLVAVDKNRQLLFLFERHSPLRIAEQYICTTGRALGDKFVSGDLKTPEGIYFVVRHLNSGLDFIKYGNEAYTLNYPNPVDKLRRKTGYGIWIHGRGEPIQPRLTEGCVSMNNGDIAVLGSKLLPGTPVALASSVSHAPTFSAPDAQTLALLEKRTRDWAKAWSARSRALFDFYDAEAYSVAQGEPFSAFRAQKERLFKQLAWIDTTVHDVQVLPGPGYWVTWFFQDYKASNLSTKGVRRLYWQPDDKGEFRIVGMEWLPNLSGTLLASRGGSIPSGPSASSDAASAASSGSGGIELASAAQAAPTPGELPEGSPDIPAEPAVPAAPIVVAEAPAQPAIIPSIPAAPLSPPEIPAPPVAEAPAEAPIQIAAAPAPSHAPVQETPAVPEAQPAPVLSPSEQLAADGARFIEKWRNAWESGDLEAYLGYYSADAQQGSRRGVEAIEAHKRSTWKRKSPALVALSSVRITVEGDTIVADMLQEYADSSGYKDLGIKTLTIRRYGDALRIVQEDWTPETP
ncbi:L,D-transpeptidase family protein [Desulfovibrio sp. OttesenSCG-928-I05]|nr:L,D-transpeptidase family protein [Desulfovibrio sp. OttesenSCG-928-I05]